MVECTANRTSMVIYLDQASGNPLLQGRSTIQNGKFFETVKDILGSLVKEGGWKTRISNPNVLDFKSLPTYLEYLEEIGLLVKVKHEDGFRYRLTKKGVLFLERYQEVVSMLEERRKSRPHLRKFIAR